MRESLPETVRSSAVGAAAWTDCTLHPRGVRRTEDDRTYAAIAVELTIHLRVLDRPAVSQHVVLDHLADAIPTSSRWPYDDWGRGLGRALADQLWTPDAFRSW